MPVTLDGLIASTRLRVAESKRRVGLRELAQRAEHHVPRGFRRSLARAAERGVAVIAELKPASPSRGPIRPNLQVAEVAHELEQAGAAALSVLTEPEFFRGSLANLEQASAATRLPCLRKDFIVDEFQLLEARAHAADAVLLIVAALAGSALPHLHRKARELGLDVLCEVHDEQDVERALDAGCEIVGVNNRDLKTFAVDLATAVRLAPRLPAAALKVAESGLHCGEDLARLRSAGYQAFLIGESLMRAESPGSALQHLLAEARLAALPGMDGR